MPALVADAIAFDWDGVIGNSRHAIFQAYQGICDRLGVPRFRSARHFWSVATGHPQDMVDLFSRQLGRDVHEELHRAYTELFVPLALQVPLHPGVRRTLSTLHRQGVRLGIVSNNRPAYLQALINRYRLPFSVVIGDDYPALKPDPAGLLECLARLACPPERALYVGDRVIDDQTARNAQVRSVLVSYGHERRDQLATRRPFALIDRFSKLLTVIGLQPDPSPLPVPTVPR